MLYGLVDLISRVFARGLAAEILRFSHPKVIFRSVVVFLRSK